MIILDRKCENPDCGKQLTVADSVGRKSRSIKEKRYCNSSCASRSLVLRRGTEIKTHHCEVCGDPVPWVSKNGKEICPTNYKNKRACNKPECYKSLRKLTADRRSGKMSARRYHEEPDLIERWYLGVTPNPVHDSFLFKNNELREMMNDLINPRLAA